MAKFFPAPVYEIASYGTLGNSMDPENRQFMGWQRAIFRYFWPHTAGDRAFMAMLVVLSLVMTASNTVLIWHFGKAITQITGSQFDILYHTLLVIAGIVLFNMILKLIYSFHYQKITLRFVDRVRGALLSKIMFLSFPINNKFENGDLISRLSGDVDRLLTYVFNVPLNLITNFVVLTVYTSMVIWIDWRLALVAFALAPLFFLSQYYIGPQTGRASRHFTREKAKLVSMEEQTLRNLKSISSFSSETFMRSKHRDQFEIARNWALKVRMIGILYNSLFTVLLFVVAAILIYHGISRIQDNQLTIGVFVSFLLYIRFLTNPVRSLARMPISMHNNRIAADRVMEILKMESTVTQSPTATELNIQQGNIIFDNVSFTYPTATRTVFSSLSASIHAGETIALVGRSGSGKSTFASLIMRFYDPTQGEILIDGTNIKSVTIESLRKQISIVWQDPLIINGSIRENLLLANPSATDEQLKSACVSAYCWEFIEQLDNTLDTHIGANGVSLSSGQVQRLAIAQAFLRDTPILIMDEASSALDSHSEQIVIEAIQSLRENRTTLMIAHRFSSIRSADRILYFNEDGSVILGSHQELTAKHKSYKEAVDWQTGQVQTQ